jgi:hypothetical protein
MQALVGMATYCPHRTFGERPRGSKIVRAKGQTNAQFKTLPSVPPEVLEPVRRQGRADRSAGDRSMAEPSLDCPSVVPLVGEGVATGVAEHVRVRLQFEARRSSHPLDHPGKAGRGERRSPLADEDKRRRLAFPLEPAQGSELVAAQGMGARRAVLDPTHMQHRRTELDLVPAEVASR